MDFREQLKLRLAGQVANSTPSKPVPKKEPKTLPAVPHSKPTPVVSNHNGAASSSSESEIRLMIREEFEKMKLSMLQEVRNIIREELNNSY